MSLSLKDKTFDLHIMKKDYFKWALSEPKVCVIQKIIRHIIKFIMALTTEIQSFVNIVPAPLKAADTIQKLCFGPSDYHVKMT